MNEIRSLILNHSRIRPVFIKCTGMFLKMIGDRGNCLKLPLHYCYGENGEKMDIDDEKR